MSFKAGILNAYDWRNRGDRAIVEAQMAWIRSKIPDAEFRIFSPCWKENQSAFGLEVSSPPPIAVPEAFGPVGGVVGPIISWATAYAGIGRGKAYQEFSSCDGYFLCGGGYLYSSHAPFLSRQLWLHVANSLLALRSGKPVMQFPQSWGPFRKQADRWISRRLASGLSRISARGTISAKTTAEMGFSAKTLNLPDVVLAMRLLRPQLFPEFSGESRSGLGIAPIEFGFARSCTDSQRAEYLGKLHQVAVQFHRKTGQPVTLFVQVSVTGHDDDAPMAERLAKLLDDSEVPVRIENSSDWIEYWRAIGRQACFIGCRMHSCIFAMVSDVPTVGLAYQPKFQELFAEINLEERCFDISDFNSEAVASILLAPGFTGRDNSKNLSIAVASSARRMLSGFDECWHTAGFPEA